MSGTPDDAPVVAMRLGAAHVAVPIDLRLYTVDATIRASYKLTDRCFVLLQHDEENSERLVAYLVGKSASSDLSAIVLEFQNELIDQQLRVRLEAQFGDVRTLIVAQAFSEGNLVDPVADDGDYRNDALGAGSHR